MFNADIWILIFVISLILTIVVFALMDNGRNISESVFFGLLLFTCFSIIMVPVSHGKTMDESAKTYDLRIKDSIAKQYSVHKGGDSHPTFMPSSDSGDTTYFYFKDGSTSLGYAEHYKKEILGEPSVNNYQYCNPNTGTIGHIMSMGGIHQIYVSDKVTATVKGDAIFCNNQLIGKFTKDRIAVVNQSDVPILVFARDHISVNNKCTLNCETIFLLYTLSK